MLTHNAFDSKARRRRRRNCRERERKVSTQKPIFPLRGFFFFFGRQEPCVYVIGRGCFC